MSQYHRAPSRPVDSVLPGHLSDDVIVRPLFLVGPTGAGHEAYAKAIASWMADDPDSGEPAPYIICDPITRQKGVSHRWLRKIVRLYGPITRRARWLWAFLWWLSDRTIVSEVVLRAVASQARPLVNEEILKFAPNVIVSCHPLLSGLVGCDGCILDIPFVQVVVNPVSLHRFWITPRPRLTLLGTDKAASLWDARCVNGTRPRVVGIPVLREVLAYDRHIAAIALRNRLGVKDETRIVIVEGGGEGAGNVVGTTKALCSCLSDGWVIVAACGRNGRAAKTLRATNAQPSLGAKLVVLDFRDDYLDWLAGADQIVGKAGTQTVGTALALGVPLCISAFTPGQESGTVRWLVECGAAYRFAVVRGRWQPETPVIPEHMSKWIRESGPRVLAEIRGLLGDGNQDGQQI